MKTVHLHGLLRKKYGGPYRFDIANAAQGIRALVCQLPGFERDVAQRDFWVILGDLRGRRRFGLDEDSTRGLRLADESQIHLFPVPGGAKSGVFKILAGVALVAASFFTAGAAAALLGPGVLSAGAITGISSAAFGIGSSLLLGGISQLISPQPKTQSDLVQNAFFSSPGNRTDEGAPVPIVYGTYLAGSVVIEAQLRTDNLLANTVTLAQQSPRGKLFGCILGLNPQTGRTGPQFVNT